MSFEPSEIPFQRGNALLDAGAGAFFLFLAALAALFRWPDTPAWIFLALVLATFAGVQLGVGVWRSRTRLPAVRVDAHGVTDRTRLTGPRFVPWDDIARFELSVFGGNRNVYGVLRDPRRFRSDMPWPMRWWRALHFLAPSPWLITPGVTELVGTDLLTFLENQRRLFLAEMARSTTP